MKWLPILAVACAGGLASCRPGASMGDYIKIHKDGIAKLAPAGQIHTQYAQVDHFIVSFGSSRQPLEWQTVAFIEGRFELTFVQPVKVDYAAGTVTPDGDPEFYLHAAESTDGRSTRYEGRLQREFGQAEWNAFVASGFDLGTLGIPASEVHPVKNWQTYVDAVRRDRIPIK
ncbi:hypothetical protein HAHE_14590 [Haloferula helveola]|uniref:Uncharacterized protein n=2 Tax=Haloferula helveola TaxID=490095 RepID=A0ABM7RCS9_9BACT|nr:hypothetical protein HAHE_14590 [Haloferula helveola]